MHDSTRTIGVFGGSFDPPHAAHVLVVSYVLMCGEVDDVLVVPTFEHAFGKKLTPFKHRAAMCTLAFSDFHRTRVSMIEAELGGPSHTYSTLVALRKATPQAEFRLIVGSDLVDEIPRWYQSEKIVELAPLIVVPRAVTEDSGAVAPELARGSMKIPAISSTEIRQRLTQGLSMTGLLPDSVTAYIQQENLYSTAPAD